jgi:iron-sulfur cluster assembly accessory protein
MMQERAMPVVLTERAVARIKQLLARCGQADAYLRIGIRAGGCSGLEYVMQPEAAPRPNDLQFEYEGLRILIDPKSARILQGTTIDYTGELIGSGFRFQNPNAKRQCSCGTSFSL